ncbi:MAG: DUF6695 family protein [Polaribacter sp.]
MIHSDGIIIILSYPDTLVRTAYWEFSSKFWPLIGIGDKEKVLAGHSALLLIKKNKPRIDYFDFGRYITSHGNGRVRSKITDPELHIPITAKFKKNTLINLEEILLWVEKHPEKTHGEGRLIAGVNNSIHYKKAEKYIDDLIQQKEIPYGAFIKKGNNCSRFVADTMIHSCTKKIIRLRLKSSYLLTPSPVGNVLKGTTKKKIYILKNQILKYYTNRFILKENVASFFSKPKGEIDVVGTELPNKNLFNLDDGTWLGGMGSGAWFRIEKQLDNLFYKIGRYNAKGDKDFESVFFVDNSSFDFKEKHQFVYPTNCDEAFIIQNQTTYFFKKSTSKVQITDG